MRKFKIIFFLIILFSIAFFIDYFIYFLSNKNNKNILDNSKLLLKNFSVDIKKLVENELNEFRTKTNIDSFLKNGSVGDFSPVLYRNIKKDFVIAIELDAGGIILGYLNSSEKNKSRWLHFKDSISSYGFTSLDDNAIFTASIPVEFVHNNYGKLIVGKIIDLADFQKINRTNLKLVFIHNNKPVFYNLSKSDALMVSNFISSNTENNKILKIREGKFFWTSLDLGKNFKVVFLSSMKRFYPGALIISLFISILILLNHKSFFK